MTIDEDTDRAVRNGSRSAGRRPARPLRNLQAKIALTPMILVASVPFLGGTIWTVVHSFTDSRLLPRLRWAGLAQYERLWASRRWLVSIENLALYGICLLVGTLVVGFVLAALLDRKIRLESAFRTILLYPVALSFIVTGLIWQWLLNPELGIPSVVRGLGWGGFAVDPLNDPSLVMYGLVVAGLWQGTGLIMCIMLAGLRGIDDDIWNAARVDGIGVVKTYLLIILPMMRPVLVTALVLVTSGVVKLYDLVVAMTSGGPGISSEVPAKYVVETLFGGQNLGQGFAASTMMLVPVVVVVFPWACLAFGRRRRG